MSLRTRLLLAVATVAVVALVAANVATYASLRSFLYSRIDASLEAAHVGIEAALFGGPGATGPDLPRSGSEAAPPPGPPLPETPVGGSCDTLVRNLTPGTFLQVRDASGSVVTGENCAADQLGGPSYSPALPTHITGLVRGSADPDEPVTYFTTPSLQAGGPQFRVRVSEPPVGDGAQLILAVPLGTTTGTLHRLLAVELAVSAAALVVVMALGWWLVRVGLRPLVDMERTADAIADGELEQRVPGENPKTEVGHLARALNVMLARIQTAFAQRDRTEAELRASEARMRRFVGDASHELRTPLAAVSAYAELFERGASRRTEDLERVMAGIRSEAGRMARLVEDLLLLARLDEGRPLADEKVELVGLCADAVRTATTVAPQWPVALDADRPVEVTGDEARIRQVVDNLLSNVRTHTPAGTSSVVRVSASAGEAVIEVIDDGPGLDVGQAMQVFERFYRADPSRSRRHGGAGLGLSIVASIVSAHGGRVSVEQGEGPGCRFVVRLPRRPATDDRTGLRAEGQDRPVDVTTR
ncbi:MAG TPA: HAMP domain-containing sensor histidine kinase [Acidimicrobiales bacterium]|nr:HAMP domain-containing sensor histidine kinase [Acidimicrobiales bacterium]